MKIAGSRVAVFESWDTTLKIPGLFLLMMAMAFVRDQRLMLLLPCIAGTLFFLSAVRLSLLLSRFRAPVMLLLFVSVFLLLFSEGDSFFTAGPFALSSRGAILALNTSVRVLSIITVGIVMVQTTPLSGLSSKLKKMLIPSILVDIGIMTGRYIMVIGEDYNKMKNARKLRGYVPGKSVTQRFKVIVPAAATLLIRGFQQSEMVFNAMHMRGYGNEPAAAGRFSAKQLPLPSVIIFLATVIVSLVLIVLELTLGTN